MAQNITLLGANYSDVPGVDLPKTGGGTARFTDVTPTTAAAADVAHGKQFYTADGTLTQGTASGGGGAGVVMGAIRGDAELIFSKTEDDMLVADLGLSLGTYTTSTRTLQASTVIETITPDWTKYAYFATIRYFFSPIYSNTTKSKGRLDYCLGADHREIMSTVGGTLKSLDGSKTYNTGIYASGNSPYRNLMVYWTSATTLSVANGTYGIYRTFSAPTVAATSLKFNSGTIAVRGSSTYFSQTNWEAVTDVRLQTVFEFWRAPITEVNGWATTSQIYHVADCINNGGDLT